MVRLIRHCTSSRDPRAITSDLKDRLRLQLELFLVQQQLKAKERRGLFPSSTTTENNVPKGVTKGRSEPCICGPVQRPHRRWKPSSVHVDECPTSEMTLR